MDKIINMETAVIENALFDIEKLSYDEILETIKNFPKRNSTFIYRLLSNVFSARPFHLEQLYSILEFFCSK